MALLLCTAIALATACADGPSREPDPGPPVTAEAAGDAGSVDQDVRKQLSRLIEQAQREPRSGRCRAELGMAYEVAGIWRAALQSYEQAAVLEPDEPRWSYHAATARAELGDLEGAIEAMGRVLVLDDSYAPAHLHHGNWLLDAGRVDGAFEAFRRATALDSRIPAAWAGLARVHLKRGEPQRATEIMQRLLKTHPDDPYLHQLLGLAYRDAGELEKARASLSRGKPQRPAGWPDPWEDAKDEYRTGFGAGMQRASDLAKQGKFDQVATQLEELKPKRPTDVGLLNNLSVAYRRLGQNEKAFQVLLEGLRSHPDYFPFHLNIAAHYTRLGQADKALEHYDKVIEIHPSLAVAHQHKAILLLGLRRLEEARDSFEATLRYDPQQTSVLLYMGVLEGELGNWQAASERLEHALRINPNQGAALIALGRTRAELGDFVGAEAALDRAAQLAPQSRQLVKARGRLAELRAQE